MKRLLLPLAAIAIIGLLLPASVRPAYACSVGPDYNPVAESDIIVAGRFTGWELIEDAPKVDFKEVTSPEDIPSNYIGPYEPIRVEMAVERVYKGLAPQQIDIIDGASLIIYDHEPIHVWVGASGACGTFDFDPTGMYAVIGAVEADDGTLRSGRFRLFYIGPEPPEEFDRRPLSYVDPLLPGALPTSGGPPPAVDSSTEMPWLPIIIGSSLATGALLAASALLLRRRLTRR